MAEKEVEKVVEQDVEVQETDDAVEIVEDEDEAVELEDTPAEEEAEEDDVEVVDEEEEKPVAKVKPIQSAEDNKKYAAARREAEEKLKKTTDSYNALLAQAGITDLSDLSGKLPTMTPERKAKLEEEAIEKGEDPEEYIEKIENREYIKHIKAKEAIQALKEVKDKQQKEFIEADRAEFEKTYPNLKVDEVLKDEDFMAYAKPQLLSVPLATIKSNWDKLTAKIKGKTIQKAVVRQEQATSSGKGGEVITISRSDEAARLEWNKNNPELAMSRRDFAKYKKR